VATRAICPHLVVGRQVPCRRVLTVGIPDLEVFAINFPPQFVEVQHNGEPRPVADEAGGLSRSKISPRGPRGTRIRRWFWHALGATVDLGLEQLPGRQGPAVSTTSRIASGRNKKEDGRAAGSPCAIPPGCRNGSRDSGRSWPTENQLRATGSVRASVKALPCREKKKPWARREQPRVASR